MFDDIKVHSIDVISKVYKLNDTAYLNKLMDTWEYEKSWFLNEWGGPIKKLKSDCNVELSLEEKEKIKTQCVNKISKITSEDKRLIYLITDYLRDEINVNEFFSNLTEKPHNISRIELMIPNGVKVGKSIKRFYEKFYGS